MTLFEIMHRAGWHPPYRPDPRCPGTVRAACATPISLTALAGRLDEGDRYTAARKLADQLNNEAHASLLLKRSVA